jgi:hypothetical protein
MYLNKQKNESRRKKRREREQNKSIP